MGQLKQLADELAFSAALLQYEVQELKKPFAGMLETNDDTAIEEVENARNLDHANDQRICE